MVSSFAYAAEHVGGDEPAAWGDHVQSAYEVPPPSDGSVAVAANCGVRTDMPHKSYTTSYQIHTRVESFCLSGIVSANSVSATT